MNTAMLEQIVNAVLYEGYMLYPYRPSSKKNCRERFTFGRVYPEAYSRSQNGTEPCVMQTQCLVAISAPSPKLQVSVRFLQPLAREVGELTGTAGSCNNGEPPFRIVPELRVGEQRFQPWHEAIERQMDLPVLNLDRLTRAREEFPFAYAPWRQLEPIQHEGRTAGVILRHHPAIEGTVTLAAEKASPGLFKVTARISNLTRLDAAPADEAVLLRTFASTHTILHVENGQFVSLLDTPAEYKAIAAGCKNLGTWPVLVGDEQAADRDVMLSSPIILYDYPRVAPESAGSLFDGTEIDEILTLRIQTMTEEEKAEMRNADVLARQLLERTEALPDSALLKMHGTIREQSAREPASPSPIEFDDFFGANIRLKGIDVAGVYVQPGARVRIRPKRRADIIDMALDGRTALVEAVEEDLEHRVHLALVLENDPGKDLGLLRQPGHRFFYGVDEVEPLVAA